MAANTFNRYEKKFILNKDQVKLIKKELSPYVKQDTHSTNSYYTICNVYYDTVEDEIIKKSVSKPVFKEKLRLRCYGEPSPKDIVYLEIKKKLNGFVNKRRTLITVEEANNLIYQKIMPIRQSYHNLQVLNEIYYYVLHKQLIPKISITYDREAYYAKDDDSLRITFDFNILTRRENVFIGKDHADQRLLDDETYLMEVKTDKAIPLWLAHILTKYNIYSNSFSKYGTEFYEHLIHNRKDDESCLNPYLTYQAQTSH